MQVVKKYVEDDFAKAAQMRDQHAERVRMQRQAEAQHAIQHAHPRLASASSKGLGGLGSFIQTSFSQTSGKSLGPRGSQHVAETAPHKTSSAQSHPAG